MKRFTLGAHQPVYPNGLNHEWDVWIDDFGKFRSFDWNVLTDEVGWHDYSIFVLDGQIGVLGRPPRSGPFSLSNTPRAVRIFLGIAVVDVFDSTVASALLIDNFQVTPVPEPATWVLLGSGMVWLLVLRRFKNPRKVRFQPAVLRI